MPSVVSYRPHKRGRTEPAKKTPQEKETNSNTIENTEGDTTNQDSVMVVRSESPSGDLRSLPQWPTRVHPLMR